LKRFVLQIWEFLQQFLLVNR